MRSEESAEAVPSTSGAPPAAPETRRRGRWPWILAGLGLLLALGIFLQRRHEVQQTGADHPRSLPPVMVTTEKARRGDIGVQVSALGLVTALNTVNVRSRVDGHLVKVVDNEGDTVKAGTLLAEIDDRPFRAALLQAQGQLGRDQAILENARRDLERYGEALARNAIPRQQYDTQIATVRQYEDVVKIDRGELANAEINLAFCRIRAPISGRVGLRLVDAGNLVHATDTNPLLVITQIEPITVIFSVAEDYLPAVQAALAKGQKLVVVAFDRAQKRELARGELSTLDNQIDATTGTIKLKSLFSNHDAALFPNQFVNASLLLETHRDVTLVPNALVQRNTQGSFVYVITPDRRAVVRQVTVVTTDGESSEIRGLEPGELLVADNFNRLTDGAKISERAAPPPP